MSGSISRGIRFTADQMLVLEYLASVNEESEGWADVVRTTCEENIDFDALLPQARSFFAKKERLIKQHRRSLNQQETPA